MTREEFDFKVQDSKYRYSSTIDRNKYLSNIKGKYIKALEQRIAELSAPKDCEGCIHQPLQGDNYYEPCGTCKRFYADYYEPKGE